MATCSRCGAYLLREWIAGTIVLALSTSLLGAQEVTGRIEGRVLGPNDAGLEEVQVTASGASLLGTRVALTDRTGRFLLHALPVGTYRVTVKRIGYRAVAVEGVSVRLGETANLPRISLLEAPVELEEITVSAEAVGLDPASTASSTRLDAHQLDALPIRDYRDIALLATGAIPSYLGGAGGIPDGINIGGATGIENTYYLDGINVTNVLKGGPGIDIPYNFIKQLEIRTGGSTGEDAQALGGVINVVTPGGGERLRGGGFAFYSADGLRAEPKSLDGTGETGFHAYDVGARVEGPALRQRLWFFGAYNLTSHREEQAPPFEQFDNTGRKHLFAGKLTWLAGPRTSAALSIIGGPERSE
jgi:hypothetical protein